MAVTLGAALLPAVAEGSSHEPGRPADSGSAEQSSIFDELTATEVIEVLADDAFSFDGSNIVVEDPAPFGPFIDDVAEVEARCDGTGVTPTRTARSRPSGSPRPSTLHSRPDATRKILLDFDGQTVTGTAWNSSAAPIEAGRYRRESASEPGYRLHPARPRRHRRDLGAGVGGFRGVGRRRDNGGSRSGSAVEIVARRRRVRSPDDHHRPTTSGTTPDVSGASPTFGRSHGPRTFRRGSSPPTSATGTPKSVAEAVAHEVGHTLGLRHDGIENSTTSSRVLLRATAAGLRSWASGTTSPSPSGRSATTRVRPTPKMTCTSSTGTWIAGRPGQVAAPRTLPSGGPSVTEHVLEQSGATNVHSLAVASGPVTVIGRQARCRRQPARRPDDPRLVRSRRRVDLAAPSCNVVAQRHASRLTSTPGSTRSRCEASAGQGAVQPIRASVRTARSVPTRSASTCPPRHRPVPPRPTPGSTVPDDPTTTDHLGRRLRPPAVHAATHATTRHHDSVHADPPATPPPPTIHPATGPRAGR